ncbi:MAG: ATP-binding protein [Solirubrobacterales bacterium]
MAIARSEPFREQACPLGVCDGSGWILGPEDVARPCECRESRLKRGRGRGVASVIPARYRGVSFERPPVSDMARDTGTRVAVGEVRKFIGALDENLASGRGIWFLGDVGTGKTTLAMLISKTALERGRSVAIYSMPKLLTRIRRTYDAEPGGDTYATFFERLTSVDLLHIDDLGAERQTEWVIEQLYSIVNERYESKRAIMFTTNTDKVEEERDREGSGALDSISEMVVEKQIGRRTFSRLTEMCGDPIRLLGQDRRTFMPLAASDTS